MLRKAIVGILVLLVLCSIVGYLIQRPRLQIVSAYAARCGCTNVFAADRTVDDILSTDLNYSVLQYATLEVDKAAKSVTASVYGLASKTAMYRPGFGCILLDGKDDYDVSHPNPQRNEDNGTSMRVDDVFTFAPVADIDYLAIDMLLAKYADPRWQTKGILVAKRDTIISEAYNSGTSFDTPLLGWSMTKSIGNALVGILVKEGTLALDQRDLLAEWSGDPRSSISLDHLLRMTSGLEWQEEYSQVSDATDMLFRTENVLATAAKAPLANDPASKWIYSSGTTNILSGLLRRVINDDNAYWSLPKEKLFDKLSMRSAFIEPDESGTYILSSYGYATLRDWASFGLLYLQDGYWNGEQILPNGWVSYSRSHTEPSDSKYGAHFWINHNQVAYPSAPADLYAAQGYQGQYVIIIPSLDLVIVRIGLSSDWPVDDFIRELLPLVAS